MVNILKAGQKIEIGPRLTLVNGKPTKQTSEIINDIMKEKSPFQKFIDSIHHRMIYRTESYYKEGWNGFADVLYEWIEKDEIGINAVGIMQKIKEMKED